MCLKLNTYSQYTLGLKTKYFLFHIKIHNIKKNQYFDLVVEDQGHMDSVFYATLSHFLIDKYEGTLNYLTL